MNYRLPVMNKVFIVGNLTKDPEFHTTNITKAPVSNFRIASSRKFRNNQGEHKEDVCYINVVAWMKLAEACNKFLKKGDPVFIEGELQSRTWTSGDGEKKSSTEILAKSIQFLEKKYVEKTEETVEEVIEESAPQEN